MKKTTTALKTIVNLWLYSYGSISVADASISFASFFIVYALGSKKEIQGSALCSVGVLICPCPHRGTEHVTPAQAPLGIILGIHACSA